MSAETIVRELAGLYAASDVLPPPASLSDLDSNVRVVAERVLDLLSMTSHGACADDLVREAMATAAANAPTAKAAAEQISAMRSGPAYCYLAFYGLDETANYMKVGMTRHPEQRLYSMATGNPLDCLWVFVSRLPAARGAFHVEQALHRHLEANKRRGEWFSVGNTDRTAAEGLARQLHGIATDAEADAGEFALLGSGDGR